MTTRQTKAAAMAGLWALSACSLAGCQWFVDSADREVYRLIEKRQQRALGETRAAPIDREKVPAAVSGSAYEFTPNPVDMPHAELLNAPATQPAAGPTSRPHLSTGEGIAPDNAAAGLPADITASQPAEAAAPARTMTLAEVLAYAFQHSRDFQTAKEDLYLKALALSLERHLWTPQFTSEISTLYTNDRKINTYDHAMETVARVGVQQKLPLGGEVTAQVINTLVRDMTDHVTKSETGDAILAAKIPLLRGAGLVAMESRFQAERDLIYAVRSFERFRQVLAVLIAGEYFNLQRLKQEIVNARESTRIFTEEVARARAFKEKERLIPLEVQRAEQNQLVGFNRELDAVEAYRTAMEAFQIRLGMSVDKAIDVCLPDDLSGGTPSGGQNLLENALEMPEVDEHDAIELALKHRLDLLNVLDRIGDAERGVSIAENQMLPDLNATGSVTFHSDPGRLGSYHYDVDRATWATGLRLEIPLDRVSERNELRKSLLLKRQADRRYDVARDQVRLDVRQAMRRVQLEKATLEIQARSRDLALLRRSHARFLFDRGKVSNREVVEAEDALLDARNRLAQAQARVRLAILQFRRDTGTLRLNDQGQWADTELVELTRNR